MSESNRDARPDRRLDYETPPPQGPGRAMVLAAAITGGLLTGVLGFLAVFVLAKSFRPALTPLVAGFVLAACIGLPPLVGVHIGRVLYRRWRPPR